MEVFPAQLCVGHFVPDATAIVADFNSLRPSTTAVGPASHLDLAIVNDNFLVDWRHDGACNWHSLNGKAVAVRVVVLANLGSVVEIFLHLDRRHRRVLDHIDSSEPLAASGADVAHDYDTKRRAMDVREGLSVHLPCQHDFVDLHFSCGNGDGVVVNLSLLKVCVRTEEFDVAGVVGETTTVLDDLLQAHAHISSSSNCAFCPWRVDKLVTITGIFRDLLYSTCATTLQSDCRGHSWKFSLILEVFERDLLWVLDHTFHFKVVLLGVDLRDTTVVSDVMIFVVSDLGLTLLA